MYLSPLNIYRIVRGVGQIPEAVKQSYNEKALAKQALVDQEFALTKFIADNKLRISEYERQNCLAYYRSRGNSLIEATANYRKLLESGKRFPISESVCIRLGFEMRRKNRSFLAEDQPELDRINKQIEVSNARVRKFLPYALIALGLLLIASGVCDFFYDESSSGGAALLLIIMGPIFILIGKFCFRFSK